MNRTKKNVESQTHPLFSFYVIWCKVTDMHYVGIMSRKIEKRIREHGRNKRQFLHKEIQRISWEGNFDWWVVEENVPSDQISECEKKWVNFFGSIHPQGYNQTCGGISNFTVSEITREKQRQRALERDLNGENNPNYGKKHTDEVKEKKSSSTSW